MFITRRAVLNTRFIIFTTRALAQNLTARVIFIQSSVYRAVSNTCSAISDTRYVAQSLAQNSAARVKALRFVSSSARVTVFRFDSSFTQMFITRVSAARALRFVSSSFISSASFTSFTASITRQLNYVSAEKRAFRRAARALKISNSKLASSLIFEHVIGLIKQMKICTNMKFADLRAKLSKHFRHMIKIMRQI